MVIPADEAREELDKKVESEVEGLDSQVDSAIRSAIDSEDWPVKYDISSYSEEVKSRLDSHVSSQGYTTRIDGDYLVIEKP